MTARVHLDNDRRVQYKTWNRDDLTQAPVTTSGEPMLCNTKGCKQTRFVRIELGTSPALDVGLCRTCAEQIALDVFNTVYRSPSEQAESLAQVAAYDSVERTRVARDWRTRGVSPLFR